jgi:signal transduction histidine kinase
VQRRLDYLRLGSAYVFERHWPDGSVIEIRGNPIASGGFVTTYTDISAFRRAEADLKTANETLEARVDSRTRELQAATEEAERANQAKTRFLAAISHDLLQPLNAANLFTHALAQQLTDPQLRPVVQNIASALGSTESLLSGLLDLSRLDAGGLTPKVRAFAAKELLDTLTTEFGVMARERGLRLDAVPSRLWLLSDPQLLRRVLQNFVANALRYTRSGHVLIGLRRRLGSGRIPGRRHRPRHRRRPIASASSRSSSACPPPARPHPKAWAWAWPSPRASPACSATRSPCAPFPAAVP